MARIFVSSTIYDLLDARSEVEAMLRDSNLQPVMSERPDSEFELPGYENSIHSCLYNVTTSDVVVLILSQRYGPKLQDFGHGSQVSATHNEYRQAVKSDKRLYIYVRDHLWNAYGMWKSNERSNMKLPWLPPGNEGLLHFLDEISALDPNDSRSNWITPFSTSTDLTKDLKRRLVAISKTETLRALVESGNCPQFGFTQQSHFTSGGLLTLHLRLSNGGIKSTLNVLMSVEGNRSVSYGIFAPAYSVDLESFRGILIKSLLSDTDNYGTYNIVQIYIEYDFDGYRCKDYFEYRAYYKCKQPFIEPY